MRKAAQPLVKVENGRSAFAEHREIARVDQDVSVRDIKFAMKLVRVGYADDRKRVHRFERSSILSSLSRYVVGLVNEKAAIARDLIHRHAVNDRMLAIDHEEDTDFRRSPFSCGHGYSLCFFSSNNRPSSQLWVYVPGMKSFSVGIVFPQRQQKPMLLRSEANH